jgi:hypothetical protein
LEKQKKQAACSPVQQKQQQQPHPEEPEKQQPLRPDPPTDAELGTDADAAAPMEVDETSDAVPSSSSTSMIKKKKKKTSYKAMMAAMTKPTGTRDAEMEKESIRQATGGGAFSKIDKI